MSEGSEKTIVEKRKLIIDGEEKEIVVGQDVPQGFWGWPALSDEDISRIANAVLRTLRKLPLVGHNRLYAYADRYIRDLFERGEDVKDNILDFVNELVKDPDFSETLKVFNQKAGKDWIQGYLDHKWSGGLGAIVNLLEKVVEGLRKLRLVRKVVLQIGGGSKVYYVPADMKIEDVYRLLKVEEPKAMAKVEILERLVELAKKIATNIELGKQILMRWGKVVGKEEARREAERLQRRLYFGKRILIAMLNEIGIRANSQNYTKYVDPITFNIRLKNEGLPIDRVALKIAMKKVERIPGKFIPQKTPQKMEPVSVPRPEQQAQPQAAPQPRTPRATTAGIPIPTKMDPFSFIAQIGAIFSQVGQLGLNLTQKTESLEKAIIQLREVVERKVDVDTVKKYTENIERNLESIRGSIAKIVENMDQDKKHIEKSFEEINSVLGELRRNITGIIKTVQDTRKEYEELKQNVGKEYEELKKMIDAVPGQVQRVVQQLITQTITSALEAIGSEIKKQIAELKHRNIITTLILTRLATATKREVPLEEVLQIHPNKQLVGQVLEELKNQKTIRIIEKKGKKVVELVA